MKGLNFTRMEGVGNECVYIDTLGSPTSADVRVADLPELSRKINNRHSGVGGDGLTVIMPSLNADFRMRAFNAYESEARTYIDFNLTVFL